MPARYCTKNPYGHYDHDQSSTTTTDPTANPAAKPTTRRAFTTTESIYGPDHSETGDLLHSLGGVLESQGKLDESEKLFKRALVIMEEEVSVLKC